MGIVAIKPLGSGVESLDATLKSLRGGGPLHRVDDVVWSDPAGLVYAVVDDPGFVVFAVVHQGYGAEAFDVTGVVQLPE